MAVSGRVRCVVAAALLVCACAVRGAVLLDADFTSARGPLAGHDGWLGRDGSIQADGKGLAGAAKPDGFAKRPLTVPAGVTRIRLAARVTFAALPESAARNHHLVGKEQPAWVALGFTDRGEDKSGLAGATLSASVTSDGRLVRVGLGRAVGAAAPAFGVAETEGDGCGELALEYDFVSGSAAALWNGKAMRTGSLRLQPKDVALAAFQLRRMRPLGEAASGGIRSFTVTCEAAPAAAAPARREPPPASELPLGSRVNAEAVRARELEARVDAARTDAETLAALTAGWDNPPATYRPHTRWWWPGNAVTAEGLDWQLEQMKSHGIGGVEVMNFLSIYEKGNIGFGSPEFLAMVKHVVDKARALGMEVALNLGPGWNHGNADVPEADRSKALVFAEQDVTSDGAISAALRLPKNPAYAAREKKRLEAVVAVALKGLPARPDPALRVDLSSSASGDRAFAESPSVTLVKAELPAGRWRLYSFWTVFTGQKCACEDNEPRSWIVDHLNKEAVRAYAADMGGRYLHAFGGDFGQTVDSVFGDSYELSQDFSLWSDGLFERFQREKGYDLRPFLPLLLLDGAPETPYVRYDFGHFLHTLGMEAAIGELAAFCEKSGVHMRQQPHYRFTAEMIEASGALQRPETELCRRSFEPLAYPHKLTTSGAKLYPSKERRWVSCEAFTFSNARYRSTLEELKRGTDLFLRDGITQFYNHGYFYTPEKEVEPARDLLWMNRISHVNTWWPWYRGLADYQARAAFLSRQGRARASVLLYSPMPTVWSERASYPCSHVRDVPFGRLPKILVASGYDFDCVNDDLLVNHAAVTNGALEINGYRYAALVLPRALCLAPQTLQAVARFAEGGGTVFALGALPSCASGLIGREARDAELRALRDRLFSARGGERKVGLGTTCFMPACDGFEYLKKWSPGAKEWAPTEPLSPAYAAFVAALRGRLAPDFEISGVPLSDGLTFRRTQINGAECWFICNLQPSAQRREVLLNTPLRAVQFWNPMTGERRAEPRARVTSDGRLALTVALQPWESLFALVLSQPDASLQPVCELREEASHPVEGSWSVSFEGVGGVRRRLEMRALKDWVSIPELRDCSGLAQYQTDVDWPAERTRDRQLVILDLGVVHEVARVEVNGAEAGKVWMQPYRVDVTRLLKPGRNTIRVEVANLLWNYAMGLKAPTPIPEDLREHYGATWNENYGGWNGMQKTKKQSKGERMPSGLLGPVALRIEASSAAR